MSSEDTTDPIYKKLGIQVDLSTIRECRVPNPNFESFLQGVKKIECFDVNEVTLNYRKNNMLLITSRYTMNTAKMVKWILATRRYSNIEDCLVMEGLRNVVPFKTSLQDALKHYSFLKNEVIAIEVGDCDQCDQDAKRTNKK